jgi:hypothetical protein
MSKNVYGVFYLDKRIFYLHGDLLEGLLFEKKLDSFEVHYWLEKASFQPDWLDMFKSKFFFLNTDEFIRKIRINSQDYYLILQPCANLNRDKRKRLKRRLLCECS